MGTAASSPKKCKDGLSSGNGSGKGRVRLDSEGKSKSKHIWTRKSSKEKSKPKDTGSSKEPSCSGDPISSSSLSDADLTADPKTSTNVETTESRESTGGSRSETPQPGAQFTIAGDSSDFTGTDQPTSDIEKSETPANMKPDPTTGIPSSQAQGNIRRNGSINERNMQNGHTAYNYRTADQPRYNGAHPQDIYLQGHHRLSSRGPSRGSADHVHPMGYGSLPRSSRSSRSTTPTPDTYNYGSLARRSDSNTPTPQTMGYYNSNGITASWGSLSRKSDSGSAFSLDKHPSSGYGVVNQYYQPPRPGSVPPPNTEGPESIYSYARSESGRYSSRAVRAGSVPLGYESESSGYGADGPRNYESDSCYEAGSSTNLRVQPGDEMYRVVGKKPIPRRHTLGAPNNRGARRETETDRKRDAFMKLLAQRYPKYADRIQGNVVVPDPNQKNPIEKPARSRDPQRRRTSAVTYDPSQATHTLEYDDLGTMSDLELPSFQRGGLVRTSLPIVRSASTSLERPLGLVFLVHRDQTKKSLLPNEITTLDTVRAIFVRAFPDLTMEMLEAPRMKIYILDPATNIYFQLEDLGEIKDRSVLKLHETDNDEVQKVRERQEVRGRTVQMPISRPTSRQGYVDNNAGPNDQYASVHTLPSQASPNYTELIQDPRNQWEVDRRSRSRTPEGVDRPRSLSAGPTANRPRYSHSPDRLPTPERQPLNPIPENRQLTPGYRDPSGNIYEVIGPRNATSPTGPPGTAQGYRGAYSSAIYDLPGAYTGYSSPSHAPHTPQTFVARSRAANPTHPQRAIGPSQDMRDNPRGTNPSRHSLAFAPMAVVPAGAPPEGYQRSQSYRIPQERDLEYARSVMPPPADDRTRNRIEKMEAQLASLTAWVHYQKSDNPRRELPPQSLRSIGSTTSDSSDTFPASSASKIGGENAPFSTITTTNNVASDKGLSDIPDGIQKAGTPTGESVPANVHPYIHAKLGNLKTDLRVLRRQQQLNMEAMREELLVAFNKIKMVISSVPGAENQVNFHKRNEATMAKNVYLSDKEHVNNELMDLESSVEELRNDVISRQCRVNVSDVEGMALLLSNITKSLADLKARFPEVQNKMKSVMDSEMRQVVTEEKLLKEEPAEIENSLKRCKKLTGTLHTLKRLASVQDHRPRNIPNIGSAQTDANEDSKKQLMENIRAMVPDHEQRMQQVEAADASRERKKKISTQQEAWKFGKTLEMASRALKPSVGDDKPDVCPDDRELENGGRGDAQESSEQNVQTDVFKPPTFMTSFPLSPTVPFSQTTTATTLTSSTNVASIKPTLTTSLTSSAKSSDKPTATVSAMTSSTTTVSHPAQYTSSKPKTPGSGPTSTVKMASLPLTDTTERLTSNVHGGTGPVTNTVTVVTDPARKVDDSMYSSTSQPITYSIKPPVFTKPSNLNVAPLSKTSSLDSTDNHPTLHLVRQKSEPVQNVPFKPGEATGAMPLSAEKKLPVSLVSPEAPKNVKPPASGDSEYTIKADKVDLASQKQAARTAFFSSLSSPQTSPVLSASSKNSTPGLGSSPTSSSTTTVSESPTINLVLQGSVSPMSPTSPGVFTIAPPPEILAKASSPPLPPAPSGSKPAISDSPSHTSQSDPNTKQKKIPPPPPPRRGSRPTSVSGMPAVNGAASVNHTSPSHQPLQRQASVETPNFVGGVLGQHRLSGGPLSSTPKSAPQPRVLSTFEKDIASGIYANLNRPDLQGQRNTPQQMMDQAAMSTPYKSDLPENGQSIPPRPAVSTEATHPHRDDRGSSSESTSSSSGASMGSQQSVVSVVRSASVNVKGSSKPKPDPPKRQSSLFSKLKGGTNEPKRKSSNGKAPKVNGVDL